MPGLCPHRQGQFEQGLASHLTQQTISWTCRPHAQPRVLKCSEGLLREKGVGTAKDSIPKQTDGLGLGMLSLSLDPQF